MRPAISNSVPCSGRRNPGAAQAVRSSEARATRRLRTVLPILAPETLGSEALQRLLQRVVLGAGLERFLPDAARLVAVAKRPQHFAQVRADLAVGPSFPGAAQFARGALQVL